MGGVGCVGWAVARVGAGVCGCTGECDGHTLLCLNSKLMSIICVCVCKLIVILVYNIECYSVMLVTS
jgi:hypothetical protein